MLPHVTKGNKRFVEREQVYRVGNKNHRQVHNFHQQQNDVRVVEIQKYDFLGLRVKVVIQRRTHKKHEHGNKNKRPNKKWVEIRMRVVSGSQGHVHGDPLERVKQNAHRLGEHGQVEQKRFLSQSNLQVGESRQSRRRVVEHQSQATEHDDY